MSKFDEYVAKYAADYKEKIGGSLDEDLLRKVTKGLGPSIYRKDAETVSGSDQSEKDTVKNNYLIKKLGLKDSPELDKAIDAVLEKYGSSNRNKYRVIVYYMLCKHFNKESVY
ncbi:MAG: DUF2853 family protein [Flavobacteriaceae bacterium]|nr:DUF2853 family protein [Flavobacteriaceae bacterium]